jgi:hypothetical protein
MKNMSTIVALVLSASAGVWMTGCAAEVSDLEDTDMAVANVDKGAGIISKGAPVSKDMPVLSKEEKSMTGGQLGETMNLPAGGISQEIESPILGKGNLGKGNLGKSALPAKEENIEEKAAEQPAVGQDLESGQLAGEEKIEDSQAVVGEETQLDDQAATDQDEADETDQEATGESQEALSDQWRGRGGFRGGYGGYRHGFRGGYGGYRHGFRGGYGYRHGFRGYYPGYNNYYYPGYNYGYGYGGDLYSYCVGTWRGRHDPICYRYFW